MNVKHYTCVPYIENVAFIHTECRLRHFAIWIPKHTKHYNHTTARSRVRVIFRNQILKVERAVQNPVASYNHAL